MNKLILCLLIGLFPATLYGQVAVPTVPVANNPFEDIVPIVKEEIILGSPNRETEDAILFLEHVPEEDRIFIRFFTTYAVPLDLRNDCILQLSFVLHSLMGVASDAEGNSGGFYPLAIAEEKDTIKAFQKVYFRDDKTGAITKTSDTLWWIDIRDFNWTPQAFESVSKEDGYFVEPIVQHSRSSLLRLLSGNAIFRADWFVFHATDAQEQIDNGSKIPIYDTLLYANGKIPATLGEWRKQWGLDIEEARRLGNESAALVTKSNVVARHNRDLRRFNTHFGWLYETYDVRSQLGKKNFIEAFPENRGNPPVRDGGEAFATNAIQMQVYVLFDGEEKLVHTADPSLARHTNDVIGDVRVNVARSCIDCHAAGPIPSENTIKEYLGTLKFQKKADALRVDRLYLNNRFEDNIDDDQVRFARSLMKINGLTPTENLQKFSNIIKWYNEPLTIEQAAFECGVTPAKYIAEMNKHDKLPGNIALLLQKNSQPIPRNIWESPSVDGIPGMFQQSMIYLYGLTKITDEIIPVNPATTIVKITGDGSVYVGSKVVYTAKVNDELPFVEKTVYNNVDWVKVKVPDGQVGYIRSNQVLLENK